MSSRKSKHNKNNSNGKKNGEDYTRQGNGTNNGNEDLSAVTFKYPGRFATLTRTILLNERLTTTELLRKVILSPSQQPPDAKKVFELYYMDEIFPFINKHAQETINTKKAIEKSWELQTNHFQKIYIKRCELLRLKWSEMKAASKGNKTNNNKRIEREDGGYKVMNHHHNHCSKGNKGYHYHNNTTYGAKDSHPAENGRIGAETTSTTVIFKYYSVHSSAKTNRHIFITSPSREELMSKITLTQHANPPTAKELFEIYYYDEILPFLKKSGQQSIRGKKDLSKVWQIQTKTFKNLYEDRAKILTEEWIKMKKEKNGKGSSHKKGKNSKKHLIKEQYVDNHQHTSYKASKGAIEEPKNKKKLKKIKKIKKMECGLIRTLLNFLLFVECTTKQECFMLLIDNQNEKYLKYGDLIKYAKTMATQKTMANVCYFHLRVCIDNFEAESLRLHTGQNIIKLCFINPNDAKEELTLFELIWTKLIDELNHIIDHQNIQSQLDDENRILSINVPVINLK